MVVGIDTLLTHTPVLDCRLVSSQNTPVPVVLDAKLKFPERYPWMSKNRAFYVLTGPDADPDRAKRIEAGGGRVVECRQRDGRLDVSEVLDVLHGAGFERILVEGGAKVFSSFIHSGVWDALYVYQAPKVYGEGGVPLFDHYGPADIGAVTIDAKIFQNDVLHRYLNERTRAGIKSVLDPMAG